MSRFNYSLVYKRGTQMHVADPLSHCSNHYVYSSEDNKAQTLLHPAAVCTLDVTSSSHKEWQQLVTQFHDLPVAGHRGVKAMYNTLQKHYQWTGMKEQIQQYVKHCQACQKSKVSN